ncbi:hypothetical protein LIER_17752 [Lithospermum erythrorhizon]|uniref:Uncharacterized protein n=1 Tax=Lithospermum erythrorhizon TaxID=34254 RepID=A0AAV3QCJ5_LITER
MIISSASPMKEVDFDAMLGEMPSFFDCVKIKSKSKPRVPMVPSEFAPATPLPSASIPTPQVRPMLKRKAKDIPASFSHPPKMAKKAAQRFLVRDSGEEETHSQGVGSQVGPVAPMANSPAMVEVTSSDTLSDPGAGHQVDLDMGHLSLQEELNAPFPPKGPASTSVAQHPAAILEECIHHREGKAPMPAYDGKYLETPFQLSNLEPKCKKRAISIKNKLLKGLDTERANLQKEVEALSTTVEERAKRVDGLSAELAKEREVAKS